MGCVYSTPQRPLFRRQEENNQLNGSTNPKIFAVINVDDRGIEINHGSIEITDNDLILHQRNKNSIVWPLRSLRRYGFDAELFSFECGRRCSTGPGIYAFKCIHAEQLFNALQESLQHCSNPTTPNNHITSPQHGSNQETTTNGCNVASPPELAAQAQPPPPRAISSPPHSYVNDIRNYINSPFYVNTGVLNGCIGPPVSSHVSGSKGRAGSARSASDINTNYAKLDDLVEYVNIETAGQLNNEQSDCSSKRRTSIVCDEIKCNSVQESEVNSKDGKTITGAKATPATSTTGTTITVATGANGATQQPYSTTSPKLSRRLEIGKCESIELSEITEAVNYIVLDLENSTNNNGATYVTTGPATPVSKTPKEGAFILPGTTPPSTPTSLKSISSNYPPQSYATIDFDKTMALSNSAANHRKI